MSDLIDRQAAIDTIHKAIFDFFDICSDDDESPMTYSDLKLLELNKAITTHIRELPSEHPELDEWCVDCKEYDKERHCCPRFKRVIRETVEEVRQTELPEPHYCRECKWSRCGISIDKHGETETYWRCLNWDGGTDEEGFCHEWERRTDAVN